MNIYIHLVCALVFLCCEELKADLYKDGDIVSSSISSKGSWICNYTSSAKSNSTVINIFKYENKSNTYQFHKKITLSWAIGEMVLHEESGDMVTLDGARHMGMGSKVVVILDKNGKIKKSWSLRGFFHDGDFSKITKTITRKIWRSSVYWLDDDTLAFASPVYLTYKKFENRYTPPYLLNIKKKEFLRVKEGTNQPEGGQSVNSEFE